MVCLQRRSQHPREENTRTVLLSFSPKSKILMDSNTDVFFFFLIFLVLGVRKKKSREDHPKRYIGKNEKQENRMGEREIKREINVLLEYLFTIWESHRIDHIRRRRLVDSKAGCVFFWLRFFPTCLVGLWKKKKKFPLFLSLNQRENRNRKIPFRSRKRARFA